MRTFVPSTIFFATALAVGAALAACGGGNEGAPPPQVPSATPSAPSSAPLATASASAAPSASVAPSASAQAPQTFSGPMLALKTSDMTADLQAIGLDVKHLPPLNKLEAEKLRKVMKTFTKALGTTCKGCHVEDFTAPTPNKKIAAHMWNDYVVALQMDGGGAFYCDSCHQGRTLELDRSDKKALAKWMDANFVDKLKRADKKEHGCPTCHGDPFEGDIFGPWKH